MYHGWDVTGVGFRMHKWAGGRGRDEREHSSTDDTPGLVGVCVTVTVCNTSQSESSTEITEKVVCCMNVQRCRPFLQELHRNIGHL